MNSIRILSEKVAAQIAAGEVVERPASVVRELTDNSIDAGAKRIQIGIENGGKRLIRVSDDGRGMSRDDLLLCIERHATSKIFDASDLSSIRTLGFRGEALPSIASISKVEIRSRPSDQLVGYRLKVAGGKLSAVEETGAPEGTSVEVRDLFFNVPARRKFLRTVKTETGHILETLSKIALPYTRIHFKLLEGGKTLLTLPSSADEKGRIASLIGSKAVSAMTEANHETEDFQLRAFLGSPDQNRARGDHVFIYVNGRSIKDRVLWRALMDGYGQRLMKGRYPQIVLFIQIDPSLVDVNVHPTKQEIRFHQGHVIHNAISSLIDRALGQHFRSVFHMGSPKRPSFSPAQTTGIPLADPGTGPGIGYPILRNRDIPQQKRASGYLFEASEKAQVLGQIKGTYIVCEARDGLMIFDQHAAHERVVYETMKKAIRSHSIESQSFLIPFKVELSMKEGQILLKRCDQLRSMGLDIDHFGGNTFLLRSIPTILGKVDWEAFLRELIPLVEKEDNLIQDTVFDALLTLMACHGAIRAGQQMTRGEMELLLEQLEDMDLPTHCPHGRPIVKKFDDQTLERMFKRLV